MYTWFARDWAEIITLSEITTEDGTPIEKNRIINEPLRTDIEFTKVTTS
ncbi:MAG: hypothetical protein IKQ49_06615 [Eubacterium sp.]|nr:hypothetical protein [Eubacterium sp.]